MKTKLMQFFSTKTSGYIGAFFTVMGVALALGYAPKIALGVLNVIALWVGPTLVIKAFYGGKG